MAKNTAEKLRIKEGMNLAILHAPENFTSTLSPLPGKVKISHNLKNSIDQIHWFVRNKAQVEKEIKEVMPSLKPGMLLWIYFPKGTSKVQTDLTRDKGWEELMKINSLQWLSLISFDDTWSTFGCRLKTKEGGQNKSEQKENPADRYIDAEKKIVQTPGDFERILKKHTAEKKFYAGLSYSNKKEYIVWMASAKKEETRKLRMEGAIQRLKKRWKNPFNN